jgi:AcrR family transcriptional regulator
MTKREDLVRSRQEKRRKQIFKGAVKVLADKGFHGTTTQEIADAAGLAKGTLYEYVKTKQDILLIVIEEGYRMISEEIVKVISEDSNPHEQLKQVLSAHVKFATNYRKAARVMMNEIDELGVEGKKRYAELMNSHIETFSSIIENGIKTGYFREINSRITSELFIHILFFFFDYGSLPHQTVSLNEVSDFIMDNFVYAMIKPNSGNMEYKP